MNSQFCHEKVELFHPFHPLSKGYLDFLFFLKDLETEDEKSNILHTNTLMCCIVMSNDLFSKDCFTFSFEEISLPSLLSENKGGNISFYRQDYSQRICHHLKKTCKVLRPLPVFCFFFSNF